MTRAVLRLAALLGVLGSPGAGQAPEAVGGAVGGAAGAGRCTADGAVCIAAETYAADVCRAVAVAAGAAGLDAGFFVRLLWQESLFDAEAVSPAGAQGIAQFMPGTAALRGLGDPFNPAEAILASAAYLKELEERFGNLGLAAAAYNAGEARVERFVGGTAGLPAETRAYVLIITDYPVEVWREGAVPLPEAGPAPAPSFQDSCVARAERRGAPTVPGRLRPWAVTIAGRDSRAAVAEEARRLTAQHDALLGGERIDTTFERHPGMAQPRHFAQVGRDTRVEAEALCDRLRAADIGCAVRRN